jgi:hypothetical protein
VMEGGDRYGESGKLDVLGDPAEGWAGVDAFGGERSVFSGRWRSVMVNVPPVAGIRETSPRVVENVERSSCAYCDGEMGCKKLRKKQIRGVGDIGIVMLNLEKFIVDIDGGPETVQAKRTYICGSQVPLALNTELDSDARQRDLSFAIFLKLFKYASGRCHPFEVVCENKSDCERFTSIKSPAEVALSLTRCDRSGYQSPAGL